MCIDLRNSEFRSIEEYEDFIMFYPEHEGDDYLKYMPRGVIADMLAWGELHYR